MDSKPIRVDPSNLPDLNDFTCYIKNCGPGVLEFAKFDKLLTRDEGTKPDEGQRTTDARPTPSRHSYSDQLTLTDDTRQVEGRSLVCRCYRGTAISVTLRSREENRSKFLRDRDDPAYTTSW